MRLPWTADSIQHQRPPPGQMSAPHVPLGFSGHTATAGSPALWPQACQPPASSSVI